MPTVAIILVAGSALMHAAWNLICKSRKPSAAFFVVSTGASITVMLPLTIYFIRIIPALPPMVKLLLLLTGLVQTVYYISLGNAYRISEISVAYPLARAVPVLLVPAATLILGLGCRLNNLVIIGMIIVCTGCMILPMTSFRRIENNGMLIRGLPFILGAAFATTFYTIIDSEALKCFRAAGIAGFFSCALIYIALENIAIEVFLMTYVMSIPSERRTLRGLCRAGEWKLPAVSGVICSVGYSLVLMAMMSVENVSYVAAFRQLSIPLGAVLGIFLLKERASLPKILGIVLISSGLILIGLIK